MLARVAPSPALADPADRALAELLGALRDRGYAFVAPTPETTRRVVRRPEKRRAADLRDVFGWSRPFDAGLLEPALQSLAERAGVVARTRHGLKSRVRVSVLDGRLFAHSAYPTVGEAAVFFGPDTCRFAAFLQAEAGEASPGRVVDVGGGCGGGGITLAARLGVPAVLTDVNPRALRLARVNAAAAGVEVLPLVGSGVDALGTGLALVVANPPYVAGEGGRAYRYGGDLHGARLSLDWALAAARRLAPGGRMLLYTGSAVVDGRHALHEALERGLPPLGCRLAWRELDPDVFGELLDRPEYRAVERIAAVGAVVTRVR